jgi:hypothetical protein
MELFAGKPPLMQEDTLYRDMAPSGTRDIQIVCDPIRMTSFMSGLHYKAFSDEFSPCSVPSRARGDEPKLSHPLALAASPLLYKSE